jgi:glyoxylate reductase
MPRVYVTRDLPGGGLDRLRRVTDVEVWPGIDPPPREALLGGVTNADGLLSLLTDRVDASLLDAAPGLRIVSNTAVGYDNIDVAACTARRIVVTNTPGVLTETVADLTFALILGFARRLIEGDRIVRQAEWPPWRPAHFLGRDVHGATLGIVGLGAIGLAVARRARGFGMRILCTSRRRRPDAERELGLEWRDLDSLLREAEYVSLHVALTPETQGLIGARELALMRPDAVLVNTARGPIVDQAALVEALREHRIAGAALDVFTIEPLPPDDPLLSLDNVLVAPHVGSATIATRTRMADLAFDNLIAFFEGRRPSCIVNPEATPKPYGRS